VEPSLLRREEAAAVAAAATIVWVASSWADSGRTAISVTTYIGFPKI